MIYLFGDSWGYSYKQSEQQVTWKDSQVFNGKDLASCIMNELDDEVCNLCKRGSSLDGIIKRIYESAKLLKPLDTIIVLQTDPLRSYFIKWYSREMNKLDLSLTKETTFIELIDNFLLEPFYKKLKLIEKIFKVNVILLGGISKLNYELCKKHKLKFIHNSASEIILPDFIDNYFIESDYINRNHLYFKENFKNYITYDISEHIKNTDLKNKQWHDNPNLFTHNHATEEANIILAKEIIKYLKAINEN